MKGSDSERDFYRQIISRSRRVRERAADSLRNARETRRRKSTGSSTGATPRGRRLRRQD